MSRRLFIAIPLPPQQVDELQKIKFNDPDINWTKSENLHVTAYFCGDVEEKNTTSISAALREIAADAHPFQLDTPDIVWGPPHRQPDMIWIDYPPSRDFTDLTWSIFKTINPFLNQEKLEIPRQNLTPHVTLARLKSPLPDAKKALPTMNLAPLPVHSIELISSTLTAAGPLYEILGTFQITQE